MQQEAQTDYLNLKYQSLTKLDLKITKLVAESCSIEQLFQSETIQHLELRNCRISPDSDLVLNQCANLNLNYNKITDIQIQAPLTELSVECNLFSSANFLKPDYASQISIRSQPVVQLRCKYRTAKVPQIAVRIEFKRLQRVKHRGVDRVTKLTGSGRFRELLHGLHHVAAHKITNTLVRVQKQHQGRNMFVASQLN
ncbi:Leucine-rich_repeat domain superfamily [Hexamita inflata]|uniref:Leucine-rich repeat domain superfamily n=1 Tax=Hexamita inflata TaxID=28002 RepID=A0AA86P0U0_9EUKA|nr:Leucine-rich repeat domain superfamily [Hexamita inflata]